jgi:hypothetical protein
MDDAGFLSELEQIEQPVDPDDAARPLSHGTLDRLDAGLCAAFNPPQPQWALDDVDPAVAALPSRADIIFAVVGFIVMMAIGAASAAFVFYDRLALLLR